MLKTIVDRKRLETLIEINSQINSNYADAKNLLIQILESATRLTGGEASSLLLVNPENRKLYFEIALGAKGPDVQKFSLNMGEGIAGWVAQHNTSIISNDVDSDERYFADISKSVGFATNSILAVPMRIKDQCVGVIELINKKSGKLFDNEDLQWLEIFANQAALAIQNAKSFEKVQQELHLLQDKVNAGSGFHTFVGRSEVIQQKLEVARRVAATDSSVLILGESGVGKELFAEQIHLMSDRKDAPLIRVNCAALPEHLLESELFGHVKGAFTDADSDRRGRFELADSGTIFLDEIGDLPLNLQAKLLRVLQQKIFEKVGSNDPVKVDVRVIAATNRDPESLIEQGKFRKDLYYRLNVLPLYIPPLRQRLDDIPELADFFLQRVNRETKKQVTGFTTEAAQSLFAYSWPGNVRELENVVERAVVICDEEQIRVQDLILSPNTTDDGFEYGDKPLKTAVNAFKRHYITKVLERLNWKQTEAAKILGIQRTYLSRLIRELEIKR